MIAEMNDGTGLPIREYVWMNDTPVAMVDYSSGSPVIYDIHTDQLGRPQKLTDQSGNVDWDGVFDPFGNPSGITGSLTMLLGFPGQYWDSETQLAQNWHRDYDPTIGRYIESDPIGLWGGVNTYAYVGGNPLGAVDPSGLAPKSDPNSPYCHALANKIKNIEQDIQRRLDDIAQNKLGLPYLPPYPGAPPSASVSGHEDLVRELQENLKKRKEQYDNDCGCGGGGSPSPAPVIPPIPVVPPAAAPEIAPFIQEILEGLGAILAA
jgi:RHS repeat-associated protein